MNRHLLLLIAFCLLVLSWFISLRHYLRIWITRFRSQPSVAKHKRKNKSRPFPFPTKRPECPLCKAEEGSLSSEATPEPPPLIPHKRGRRHSIYTDRCFCPNNDCEYYGWFARGNICSNGHPNSGKWRQLKCIVCKTYFMETEGTIFYCSKVSPDKMIFALKVMAEGLGIQSTARILDLDVNTVQDWLKQGSEHMEAVSNYLMRELNLSQVQVDELWSLLGERDELAPQKRNTRWVWIAIDPESKLCLDFLIADRSLESAQVFIHQMSQLLAPGCVPLFLSDGYKPYATAILTHFGHWVQRFSEKGRRLPLRWMPLPDLTYAQVVKRRVRKRLVSVKHKVVYGSKESVRDRIRQSIGNVINTSFVERMNLTLRHHVPALARRTIQIAKTALGLEQQLSLVGAKYNFCLPHSSLRLPLPAPIPTKGNGSPKLWEQRTPAMAAGITDHIWTMEELLMFRAPPYYQPLPKRIAA
jgi:IS1 family transposase